MKKYLENDEDVEILETWKDLKEYLTFRAKHDEWVQPFINELAAIGIPNHPLFFQTNCTNLSVQKNGYRLDVKDIDYEDPENLSCIEDTGLPVTFIVNTNVDRNDIDHPLHLYHRIELTFSTGRLCLVNTHGPVIWLPFLHMPRDEYGTLSINVEEEVNIPSGVTIGNVMLPSVKETFEQIWPDAVKKALEILFKQNRTEKMSMAQYQIYVSKLWSEICQKVGYMNIVDYDNFGDIKSIFYDLEKRHLIKKENDGIE